MILRCLVLVTNCRWRNAADLNRAGIRLQMVDAERAAVEILKTNSSTERLNSGWWGVRRWAETIETKMLDVTGFEPKTTTDLNARR